MNISTVRLSLNRLIDGWRTDEARKPVYIGPYGSPEAVLAPLSVWRRLIALVADAWDAQSAVERSGRLDHPAGPQMAKLGEIARAAGCDQATVPVLESRGVPRGASDLAVWPQALDDLRKLAVDADNGTPAAVVRAVGELLRGKADRQESRAGYGLFYTVAEVDGLHAVVLTTRTVPRPAGRRGNGGYHIVELIAVGCISW